MCCKKERVISMKKSTAFILALAAVLSLSACSSSPQTSSEENSKQETVSTAPATISEAEKSTTSLEVTEPVESEPEPAGPVADTAYWDLLCEEYDRCYDTTPKSAILKDGKLMGKVSIKINNERNWFNVFSYDTLTKQIEYPDAQIWSSCVFIDGKIYSPYLEGDISHGTWYYKCYDLNVNELAKSEPIGSNDVTIKYVSEDGSLIDDYYCIFSPDLSELKGIKPEISYDIGHGKTETFTKYKNKGVYKNNLYLECSSYTGDTEYHIYDLSTGKTEKIDESTNLYTYLKHKRVTGQYGKYCISEKGIFDIETDKIISELNLTKNEYKLVGHSMFNTFENKDGNTEVYKYVLPENWNEFSATIDDYIKEYGTLVYTSENELESIDFLTEDYIIIQDNAGCFLVNLTDGSEVEFVIPE